MSSFLVALLLSVSASTWIYTKLLRSTGGNTKNAATGAAILGVILLLVAWMIMAKISH